MSERTGWTNPESGGYSPETKRRLPKAPKGGTGQTFANAQLIAAAPDLLAACRIAREALRALRGHADDTTADFIEAAIRKAEGHTTGENPRDEG